MAGEGGREGGGVHQLLVQLWVRKKFSLLKFFDVWRPHQYFVYVFHEFFSAFARFACPSLCLEYFPSEMQHLQNGFEAGKSERQGNSLVWEKSLISLNAVPAWTKLKKTTLQWRVLIMQSKILICHVCPIAGEIFFASLSPKCSNFSVPSPSSNYSCQNPFPGNGDTRNSLGSRFFSVSGIA